MGVIHKIFLDTGVMVVDWGFSAWCEVYFCGMIWGFFSLYGSLLVHIGVVIVLYEHSLGWGGLLL